MTTVELTAATFGPTVTENEIVLVDFWASWCGPCPMFAPIFEAASAAALEQAIEAVLAQDTETAEVSS